MSRLLEEERLAVTAAARQIFRVSPETAWRWALRGVRGVKLESFVVGGRRFTSREACQRFLASLNRTPPAATVPSVSSLRAEAAARRLDEAGI